MNQGNEPIGPALSYEDYLAGTKQILDDSQNETEPYDASVAGRDFTVLPNVFSPKYFNDTEAFALNLPVRAGEEMLEIGPGTGAVAITAAFRGAGKVVAVDINSDAVRNTQLNIDRHGVADKVEVREGNLYEGLKPDEKFDTIFWNTPFGLVPEGEIPDLTKAVYDPGYKATERFVREAHGHLKENGRLLIGFSTTLGRFDLLQKFVEEAGMEMAPVYEVESEEVHPVRFEIFEARPKR